ncbi:hypothetical protein BSL78_01912 [Apostichopus japonicus]|uniref:MHD2 domain-containing protein n=1 Tax=Stichopus japonicus TaxID=307972 RepID=A0A2G8LLS3_STIJA|nr:hypothetical protein BSL78_01912 [Apostichopus japonicus]
MSLESQFFNQLFGVSDGKVKSSQQITICSSCLLVVATFTRHYLHCLMAAKNHSSLGEWAENQPTHVSPDRVFKPFFNNLRLNSANFSLVWQAEEMNMPEGTLANLEDYFKKYLASHRATTVLQSPSTPAQDYTFPNIQSDAPDSGIDEGPDPRLQGVIVSDARRPNSKISYFFTEDSLYKHALLCAQFPVLSRNPTNPSLPPSPFSLSTLAFSSPPISPAILSRSYSSGGGNSSDEGENLVQEEMLCSLVREAFRLTEDSHISYIRAITEALGRKPPAKQSIAYELWQQEERMLVGSFVSQFWTGHLPAPNSHLCKPEYWKHMQIMYKELLIKLLRHDQRVDGASNNRVILHSSSRRLLKEFALRYGVSDIYQRAVFLEYLSEEENFVLNKGYLNTTLNSMTRLRALMLPEGGQCYTLESELHLAVTVLCQIQTRCEAKLQGMLQKSLSSHIVGILLTLLSEASQLVSDLGVDTQVSLTDRIVTCINKCFDNWFYHHRLRLTTELHLNSYSAPVSAELISKLVIWIQNEVLDWQHQYFAVFESYSVDVNSIACHSFYKKLMVDVRKLYNLIQSDTAQDHSYVGSTADLITLARKLDKLSQAWSHIIAPSQETWRFLFIQLAHRWLKQIRKDLHKFIKYSVEKDDFKGMKAPLPSEGAVSPPQRTLPSSAKFSPSFGSAFRSISPPGSRGRSLLCMIQPASDDMGDPFLVEGWQNSQWRNTKSEVLKDSAAKTADDNSDNRVVLGPERSKVTSPDKSEEDESYKIQSISTIRDQRNEETRTAGGWEESEDLGDNEERNNVSASLNNSSGYGPVLTPRHPCQSQTLDSHLEESVSVVTAPFSGSVFDFLTMMSCTSQFLKELCVVLLPESRDFFAGGDFEALRRRLEDQRAQCMLGNDKEELQETEEAELSNGVAKTLEEILLRSPKEILETLMPLYAVSLLAMDLCSTPALVAKKLISDKVLDFVNEMHMSYNLPHCRHQREPVTGCNVYVNRKDDYICDRFEPITPEMCVRINNVETLSSSKIWLFQDCPQTHPFLSSSLRRGEDEDGEGVQTLKLEDLHSAQINILAYKVNLVQCKTMKVLLLFNTGNIHNTMRPYLTCLHNHLMVLSTWLYPQSYHLFCSTLWEMIMQDISDTVKIIPQLAKKSEQFAGRLIQFVAKLLKEFTQEPYGRLSSEKCLILGQPILKVLELYTLPTSTIIATYQKILAQNWSSGYLHSSCGFLSQALLDFLSLNLHQKRKCFTVSHLSTTLQKYKEEQRDEDKPNQSVNTSKEEWTLGVVNEMMERRLLHPVTGGPQGSTSGTGNRSTPSELYSEESEQYIFPEVTVHTLSEAPSDIVDSYEVGSSPPSPPQVIPDVRTLLSQLPGTAIENELETQNATKNTEEEGGGGGA